MTDQQNYQIDQPYEIPHTRHGFAHFHTLSRIIILTLGIVCALALAAHTTSTSVAQGGTRPADEALNWGRDHFPYPDWIVSIAETTDDVTGTWQQAKTLIRWRWQYQYKNLKPDEVSKDVDDKWVGSILNAYKEPKILARCIVDKYTVIDASGKLEGDVAGDYRIHYYVWSDDKGFKDVFMVFDSTRINTLDTVAKQFLGNAYQCPPGSVPPTIATQAATDAK